MEIKVINKCETPNESEVETYEFFLGIKLPEDFKLFLLKYNAIYVEQNTFLTSEEIYYIDRFFPFCKEYELSLQNVNATLFDYFNGDYLVFANDPGNWQYVLSLKLETFGSVYICRMDDILPDSLTKLASSFTEFTDGLKREDAV